MLSKKCWITGINVVGISYFLAYYDVFVWTRCFSTYSIKGSKFFAHVLMVGNTQKASVGSVGQHIAKHWLEI